jgi:acetyltransferase-like isoleucine patch superfamily enzyme
MENILINIFKRDINKITLITPGDGNVRSCLQKNCGVHIGNSVWINQYVYVDELYPESVSIGDNTGLLVNKFR